MVASIETGFKFGRAIVEFGAVPHDLYARLDGVEALDAAEPPYQPQTGADEDDLRYLWRKLGFAKEAGEASRKALLTWNDGADTVSDTELEAMREVLERHYANQLPTLEEGKARAEANRTALGE